MLQVILFTLMNLIYVYAWSTKKNFLSIFSCYCDTTHEPIVRHLFLQTINIYSFCIYKLCEWQKFNQIVSTCMYVCTIMNLRPGGFEMHIRIKDSI